MQPSHHFSNARGSKIIPNLEPEVTDKVHAMLHVTPQEYAMAENDITAAPAMRKSLTMMTRRKKSIEKLYRTLESVFYKGSLALKNVVMRTPS